MLGYVDDVLLLPGLIYLAIKRLPPDVLADCRRQAEAWMESAASKPRSRMGAVLIVAVWVSAGLAAWFWFVRRA